MHARHKTKSSVIIVPISRDAFIFACVSLTSNVSVWSFELMAVELMVYRLFSDRYDCVSGGGMFAKGHCKEDCLPELIRITKPGTV